VERQAGDVTAGMRVSGTLKNPKMTFFSASDPGMSQSEALNYMLTGKGSMGQTSGEDAQQGIAVGTYVAPKLYMEYENEPEDRANKVRLRYDLTNKIQIQTETGDQQGIDIFYKIDR
jgi:translocation and assembly module TamB